MDIASSTYRRIFVLGSGFSKSFCPQMPTLRDLNELIPFGISDEFPHRAITAGVFWNFAIIKRNT